MENPFIELRLEMISDARSYNKYLTFGYLNKKPLGTLINFTHPLDREYCEKKLRDIKRFINSKNKDNERGI